MKKGIGQGPGTKLPVIGQSTIIILAAVVLGISVNQLRRDGVPLVGDWSPEKRIRTESGEGMTVSLEDAARLFRSGVAVFLDARSPDEFQEGHIQGARNLPWQSFDDYFDKVIPEIPPDALVVTYCDGDHCGLSEDLAGEMRAMGYENVLVLVNGWSRWEDAGLPVAEGGGETE